MKINLTWQDFKTQLATGLPYKYLSIGGVYYLYASDGSFEFECIIKQNNGDDQQDFETNYKNNAFTTLSQFDVDGAQIVRIKAAKKGWTYMAMPFEFVTSDLDSLFSQKHDGTNRNHCTLKLYDINDVEITDPLDEATAVKTVIDFEPNFDYEIIGGNLRIEQDINSPQDCRLWIIAVPDIPANMGGSKEMAGGVNLKYLAPQNELNVDGRVAKFLTYYENLHTNKMRFIFKHNAGFQVGIHVTVELYKQ